MPGDSEHNQTPPSDAAAVRARMELDARWSGLLAALDRVPASRLDETLACGE